MKLITDLFNTLILNIYCIFFNSKFCTNFQYFTVQNFTFNFFLELFRNFLKNVHICSTYWYFKTQKETSNIFQFCFCFEWTFFPFHLLQKLRRRRSVKYLCVGVDDLKKNIFISLYFMFFKMYSNLWQCFLVIFLRKYSI